MDTVKINLTGDRQAGLRFEEFPDELYAALKQEVTALTDELFSRVQAATPELTGELRSKERVRIFTDENRITGYVDFGNLTIEEIKKAAALEYGAHKETAVKSHSRKLDHAWANALAAPLDVIVAAYSRTPNIAERAFERGPLAEMRDEINSRLNAVVEKAVAQVNQ